MPTGGGVAAGPFIPSQTSHGLLIHWIKVVYPAFPSDAKGLLISSINDPNPVMFLNTKLCIEVFLLIFPMIIFQLR